MQKYKIITGNVYEIKRGMEYNFRTALIHYKEKHKLNPSRILINPNDLTDYIDGEVFVWKEDGQKYVATIIADTGQAKGRFTITNDVL